MGNKNCLPGRQSGPSSQWTGGHALTGLGAVSSTNSYTSETFNCANLDNVMLHVVFTGTMTGTLSVGVSGTNVNFPSLTFNPLLTQPSGSNLEYTINLNQLSAPYLNVQYTNATGSGTLTVTVCGKDLN